MTWRTTGPGQFYDAGEDFVVYFDSLSGDTHLIGAFAAFIIEQLRSQEMSLEALTERATPVTDYEESHNLREAIEEVVLELESLDIVEQV